MSTERLGFNVPPRTTEDLKRLYDHIYRNDAKLIHPKKGKLKPYGWEAHRDDWFVSNLLRVFIVNTWMKVLDASCGRGHLTDQLHSCGWRVTGTEVSKWLIENVLEEKPYPVHLLAYDELDQLQHGSFHAICSNDVLEHMANEEMALKALENFKKLLRPDGVLLMSIACAGNTVAYPTALGLLKEDKKPLDLHQLVRGRKWWATQIGKFFKVERIDDKRKRICVIARHKED